MPPLAPAQPIQTDKTPVYGPTILPTIAPCLPTLKILRSPVSTDEGYAVSDGPCQLVVVGTGESRSHMVAALGTQIGTSKSGAVVLHQGRLLAVADKRATKIKLSNSVVNVPPSGTVIVEQKSSGVMRVANLGNSDIDLVASIGGKSITITTKSGEEIVLAGINTEDDELIPVDGTARVVLVKATIVLPGVKMDRNRFDRREMFRNDSLLQCRDCLGEILQGQLKDLAREVNAEDNRLTAPLSLQTPVTLPLVSSTPESFVTDSTECGLAPIAYTQAVPVPSASVVPAILKSGHGLFVHQSADCQIDTNSHPAQLKRGDALVVAEQPATLRVGHYLVNAKKGVAMMVSFRNDIFTLRNLYEEAPDSVKVSIGNRASNVAVGCEVVVGSSEQALLQAVAHDSIGRRRMRVTHIQDGAVMATCEVSLVALFQHCKVVSAVMDGKYPDDGHVLKKLLKMPACLMLVTQSHGSFSYPSAGR